ncbi:MFS transporter [Veillonella agrestimuris]|uniref:MFS transporter n=1 Tax=Veillonella agrestimuris TaxID=2941340 RepID=UPI00203AF974|nr:MFS transporter [Veillonella agrestimuris]
MSRPIDDSNRVLMDDNSRGGMRNVWIITISMTVLAICYTMIVPFLPIYLLELGVNHDEVALWSGLVFGITFLIAGIMAPIWGKIADNRGKKMMAIRAGVAIALSYIMIAFVTDQWQLLIARAFQGFANGFYPAAMTMVSLSVEEKRVGQALGIFQIGLVLGNVVGPFLGGATESLVGMRPVFFIAGAAVFLATLAVWIFVKEPQMTITEGVDRTKSYTKDLPANANHQTASKHVKHVVPTDDEKEVLKEDTGRTSIWDDFKLVKNNPVLVRLLWIYFFMQCAMLMVQPILALYIGSMQGTMDEAAIVSGTILSIGGIAGALTTNVWVRVGEKKGYFKTISYCMMGSGIVLLLQSMPLGVWWFGILQVIIGCFIVGINPSLSAAITINTDPSFRGRMFGMTTTAQQFGSMVGPVFASVVSTWLGYPFVFGLSALLLLYLGAKALKLSNAYDHKG